MAKNSSTIAPFAKALLTLMLAVGLAPGGLAYAQDTDVRASDLTAGVAEELTATSANGIGDASVSTSVRAVNSEGQFFGAADIPSALAAASADSSVEADAGLVAQSLSSAGFVIVLDPGHGGYDSGAAGNGLLEKDVNLKIAQYCRARLEQTPGVTVYMTRSDDTYVSLSDRTQFAVDHGADLVASIHNNAGGGSGSEVIVPNAASWMYEIARQTGLELGGKILSNLNALGLGTHAGVYSRDNTVGATFPDGSLSDYYALVNGPRKNGILGIIIEHAFIDNSNDAAWLNNDANLKKLGEADADAIIEYYDTSAAIDRLYWGVYNSDYYVSHNAGARSAANGSNLKAFGYFKQTGMAAGQQANALFNPVYYKAAYGDLRNAFGDDFAKYYGHFIEYGMMEGRRGSEEFDPAYYKAAYSDLQNAFGDDLKRYYRHYVECGISEGRSSTGDVSALFADSVPTPMFRLYNPNSGEHFYTESSYERDYLIEVGWSYEGTAWNAPSKSASPVFRLYNPNAGDHHYTLSAGERDSLVRVGWNYEGVAWRSDDDRTMPLYRLYNPNAVAGAHHYTTSVYERDHLRSVGWNDEGISWFGLSAGIPVAAASASDAIMGASQTSADQMVRRFNAVGKPYPSGTYAKYGASDIRQFCQILHEEAAAEGVRAEVVFAQAMHETGWLQYGGDVSADQCNFAGIGATGGVPGNSFNTYGANSVRMGLRAQIQHLKAYASTDSLNNPTVDPRFSYVTRGCAPTVQLLSNKWATSSAYGAALISQMKMLLEA